MKNYFFLQFYKRKFKIFSPFLKLHVIAMKKIHFFTLVLKLGIKLLIYLGSGWSKQVIVVLRAHLKVRVQKSQIWGVVGLSVVTSLIAYIG